MGITPLRIANGPAGLNKTTIKGAAGNITSMGK
jgi:hypothetical protein